MLEGDNAKKMEDGRIDEVMAEEKNGYGDQYENRNKYETSQASKRATIYLLILHAGAGTAKNLRMRPGFCNRPVGHLASVEC